VFDACNEGFCTRV